MFSTLRTRFGIPGVISVMALVFAMFGGAYAASNDSGGGKATASAAKGKPGPRGKTGKTGPAGPVGPAGPAGAAGPKGDAGVAGSNGAPGASVTNTAVATGNASKCNKLGGAEFSVGAGAPTFACNGKAGEPGSPWTVGGTLPGGATETGIWTLGQVKGSPEYLQIPLSFPIPLSAPLGEAEVHYINSNNKEVPFPGEEVESTKCPGSAKEPLAAPGNLCVYTVSANQVKFFSPIITDPTAEAAGASSTGAIMTTFEVNNNAIATGTFAVTAP